MTIRKKIKTETHRNKKEGIEKESKKKKKRNVHSLFALHEIDGAGSVVSLFIHIPKYILLSFSKWQFDWTRKSKASLTSCYHFFCPQQQQQPPTTMKMTLKR